MDSQAINANYNSLQVTAGKGFTGSLTVLANYTYSKSLDDQPYGGGVADIGADNMVSPVPWNFPNFRQMDYGPSEFDRTHNFVVSYVWALPKLSTARRWMKGALGGWEWTGILTATTGDPLTLLAGQDQPQTALGADHVVDLGGNHRVSGACQNVAPCVNWLAPNTFALPPIGSFGNSGKGSLRRPGLVNWDTGPFKNFSVTERWQLQFRAEFFNVLNHANFNDPNNSITGGGFGQIFGAHDLRIGQLALKLLF